MTDDILIKFYDDNKHRLIPLYKSSIVIFDNFLDNTTRKLPPLHIVRVKTPDGKDIIFLQVDLIHGIIYGHPVAYYTEPNTLFTHLTTCNVEEYDCDECKNLIIEPGYHCFSCDYDLCDTCALCAPKHQHPMFKNKEYFFTNTYDQCDVVSEYKPSDICNCF